MPANSRNRVTNKEEIKDNDDKIETESQIHIIENPKCDLLWDTNENIRQWFTKLSSDHSVCGEHDDMQDDLLPFMSK